MGGEGSKTARPPHVPASRSGSPPNSSKPHAELGGGFETSMLYSQNQFKIKNNNNNNILSNSENSEPRPSRTASVISQRARKYKSKFLQKIQYKRPVYQIKNPKK